MVRQPTVIGSVGVKRAPRRGPLQPLGSSLIYSDRDPLMGVMARTENKDSLIGALPAVAAPPDQPPNIDPGQSLEQARQDFSAAQTWPERHAVVGSLTNALVRMKLPIPAVADMVASLFRDQTQAPGIGDR